VLLVNGGALIVKDYISSHAKPEQLRRQIEELRPWFHNFHLGGIDTAPDHFLADYPEVKWSKIESVLPEDLSGKTVLDIGCNAGFYAIEMKKRGARKVLGLDTNDRYLQQASLASQTLGIELELKKCSVYDLDQIPEQFDIVLFMGLFYHLRYPLYALDKVVQRVSGSLLFQTMIRPSAPAEPHVEVAPDYDFWEEEIFMQPAYPRMQFMENAFAGDQTNWWIANTAGAEAMLRSSGLKIIAHPESETWLCVPKSVKREGRYIQDLELRGELH
jgi:tRNA (mo5U34)-methyltransferase